MVTPVKNVSNKKNIQYSSTSKLPLVVIVGPTASGKTATALEVARAYGGEIICADSRTVYKRMDIGTAKPTRVEREEIPHWGLDLVEPGQSFTAADFKKYATKAIADIRARGRLPILVGGTGLYVDGVIFDYDFVAPDEEMRSQLELKPLNELIEHCVKNNITLPKNQQNKRHVMRAIERNNISGKRLFTPIPQTIIVGITTKPEVLRARIEQRAEHLFERGVVEEAKMLGQKYGWNSEAMTGNIYKLVGQFLDDELTKEELKQRFITSDWQLAKRQLTWLKRNEYIVWKPLDEAFEYISKRLEDLAEVE